MDAINPTHYKQGDIECIDAIESATIRKKGLIAVCTANVIKYLWRCEDKGGLEDLKKALTEVEQSTIGHDSEDDFIGLFGDVDLT